MYKGPISNSSGFDAQDRASEAGTPLTFQYGQTLKGFNATQQDTLQSYFDDQIFANFEAFIITAPEPLKALRQLIVAYAPKMPCECFELLINRFYPDVPECDKTHEQNAFFRALLIRFNKLCNKKLEIEHPLYQTIFDPRISPTKSNSPTKQNLVANFFTKRIEEHFAFPAPDDQFVAQALTWVRENTAGFNQTIPATVAGTARRQLKFE